MSSLTVEQFDDYFRALSGHPPYDWQQRLLARAVNGDWYSAIDLPTGSGKTACVDIAVFALACQASREVAARTAPRRVFFCVNRRVIVDEAHERAKRIAHLIWDAEQNGMVSNPVLREVAKALRALSGLTAEAGFPPLDVLELRGGIYRDNRWARSATQPTIICTTIDQLGSRLLFRGYGVSSSAAPIQAALIAYDSLILLDEAHISRPFDQTLQYVRRYLDPTKWAMEDLGVKPAIIVPMTATPSEMLRKDDVIRLSNKDRENAALRRRLTVSKLARLKQVVNVISAIVEEAKALTTERPSAVGIIVNRVATAKAIYEHLREQHPAASVELVIGSMRPIDRDKQAKQLRPLVGPSRPEVTEVTSVIVSTQCLEVGADYDFDVLLTECASLDALRQRFGRLNRGGRQVDATAAIFAAKRDLKPEDKIDNDEPIDPIYGNAVARTWNWLSAHTLDGAVDFGIDAFNALLEQYGDEGRIPLHLLSPSASLDAPVMLPAYVDFWCQTSPPPVPDPDVSLFIHGPQRGEPDILVCWRADLMADREQDWIDVLSLLPPTSAECMSVPLSRLRRWLRDQAEEATDYGDLLEVHVESENDDDEKTKLVNRKASNKRGILWRGGKDSVHLSSADDLRPGDTLVLRTSTGGWNELGHVPTWATADEEASVDIAEDAFEVARDRVALRLHPSLRKRISDGDESAEVKELFRRGADSDNPPGVTEWRELLGSAMTSLADERPALKAILDHLCKVRLGLICEPYPDGQGVVLTTRKRLSGVAPPLSVPSLDDGDDDPSRVYRDVPVPLDDHTRHVVHATRSLLACLPLDRLVDIFVVAAQFHDLGKSDERFQAMLCRTNCTDAWLRNGAQRPLLAKSDALPLTPSERHAARDRAGLPEGFRHEMLSVQIAERSDKLSFNPPDRDLVLHLISAHHGYARPFAPVVLDDDPPAVEVGGIAVTDAERKLAPPHRFDSGIAERFWSLTRRFGWWGLAYLEAILRLSDQHASAEEDAGRYENAAAIRLEEVNA